MVVVACSSGMAVVVVVAWLHGGSGCIVSYSSVVAARAIKSIILSNSKILLGF